ncbi:MAG TPA: SGNH/GDSL hydrolase family protein [Candidatus Mediterraneibacter merdipullorum]|nr:SGNH/GDSL hydrolase family protein [Candidatus Mediterraneibacter merdipullorum]
MRKKRFGRCVLFFVILFVLLGAGSSWVSSRAESISDFVGGRNRPYAGISAEPGHTIDMVVLGDSESYTSVSPLEIWKEKGIPSYVCGQPGQKVQETYYMLRHALENQSPKLVVLETNLMFRNPGIFGNIQAGIVETLRYHMPVFRYHNLWKLLLDGKKPNDDFKGFTVRSGVKACDTADDYMKETDKAQEMPKAVEIYMEKIQKLCKKKGARLVLLSVPSPKNYNYKKHNALEAYAEAHRLDYIDLNLMTDELGIDWEKDSYDKGDHLNLRGAQKVTAWLSGYLAEHYDMADRRSEPAYREWDELLEKYEKRLETK